MALSRTRGVPLLVATVVLVGAAFLVGVAPWATEEPGYSLDGFNASTWGLGARAAADDLFASRAGGVQPDGNRYANHPPLTVWAATVGDWASGGAPWAVRAPAVLASLAALALLAVVLCDAGLRPGATAAGVVVAGTSGMFLTYGAMLDTPVVSLPFGLLALAAAQRAWQGRAPTTAVLMAVGALAALSGWQAALTATLAAGVCGLGATTPPSIARRAAGALVVGVALGAGVTVAWIGWVRTSLSPLFEQAGRRVDGQGTSAWWGDALGGHLLDLYGPWPVLVGLLAAVVAALVLRPPTAAEPQEVLAPADAAAWLAGVPAAGSAPSAPVPPSGPGADASVAGTADGRVAWWRPRGVRPLAAILVVAIAGYTLLFRNGAAVHDYWTYWGVALVGLAVAAVAQVVLDAGDRSAHAVVRVGAAGALTALVLAGGVAGTVHRTRAEERIREGLDVLPLLDEVPDARDPRTTTLAVHGSPGELPWADIATHGHAVRVDDLAELRRLPPDLPVLVVLHQPASPALQARAVDRTAGFVLLPAGELVDHLEG